MSETTLPPRTPVTTTPQDVELKARHRAMWALGDYPTVATDVIPRLGSTLVDAARIGPGQRVLDVAAGSGNVAIPAALAGAEVVASDLTPALLEAGRRSAEARGATLTWQAADVEDLPFADDEFDAVLSCVGAMFAPHHQVTADEMLRVLRPGGTLGLVSWTPEGFIGRMFATMKPYVAPPPPGASPPPLWGDEAHVRSLLGDRVRGLTLERRANVVDRFGRPEEFVDFFKRNYGPTIAAYRGLQDDPDRTAELDRALIDLCGPFPRRDGRMEWEYLLLTATRA